MLKTMKPCIMNKQLHIKPQQRPQAAEGGTWLAVGKVHAFFARTKFALPAAAYKQ